MYQKINTNCLFQKAGNYVAPDKKGDNMIRRVNEANKVDSWQKMQDNIEHYIKKFNLYICSLRNNSCSS